MNPLVSPFVNVHDGVDFQPEWKIIKKFCYFFTFLVAIIVLDRCKELVI